MSAPLEAHASCPATRSRPSVGSNLALEESKRAQGMPGDDLTHGPPATKKGGGSHHRWCRILRHSLRDGLRLISRSPWGPGFLAPIGREIICGFNLSVGRPEPRDFAVRASHVRLTCPPRPPHPRPTYRDDRPKRPSSSRRDVREHRCDLPDAASADTCDRLARRAICAWRACGNCPSGK
jgi:hypothetical protein